MKEQKFKVMFLAGTALNKGCRATHTVATGGFGAAKIVYNPKYPPHEFFEPGRTFPVRIRHANLTYKDDAGADGRSLSIKFADSDSESPFDLVMNTGEANVFWDIASFEDFAASVQQKATEEYVYKNPY